MTSRQPGWQDPGRGGERRPDRGDVHRRIVLLKRGSVVAAVAGFGAFAALAAAHSIGVTSHPASVARTAPAARSSTQPASGGFFAQDGLGGPSVTQAPPTSSPSAQEVPASPAPAQAPVAVSGAS